MANTKKYVSFDKLSLYDEKLKKYLGDADKAVLDGAKEYADSLATNYDVAGAASTVQGKLDEEILRAKAAEEANAAAAKKAQDEVDALELVVAGKADQTALDTLSNKVGNVPEGSTVMGIITNIQENAYDDTEIRGLITGLTNGKADKTQVATDIADAKTELEGKITTAQNAADAAQDDIDEFKESYATDKAALEEAIALKADKTALEEVAEDVADIAKDYLVEADKTALEGKITAEAERAAGIEEGLRTDVDAIKGDYLKSSDKTELEGKIDLKAAQTALDAEIERATGVEESLQNQINTIMSNPDAEGAINSINEFENYVKEHGTIADGMRADINKNKDDIAANAERIEEVDFRITSEVMDEKTEGTLAYKVYQNAENYENLSNYTHQELDSVCSRLDTNELDIAKNAEDIAAMDEAYKAADEELSGRIDAHVALDHDFAAADATLKSELEGKINAKADASALADAIEALEGADEDLAERLDAVEAMLGDGDNTVSDLIAAAEQRAKDAAAKDASDKDVVVLGSAQDYAKGLNDALAERVAAVETASAKHALASDLTALDGRVTTAEGEIDTLQTEMDAVEALAAANESAIKALQTASATHATKTEVEAISSRVTDLETWHNNFVECSQEDINSLFPVVNA